MALTPLSKRGTTPAPTTPSTGGLRRLGGGSAPTTDEDSGVSVPAIAAGAAGLGALALAAKAPGRVGKVASGLNALRQQLMLSGFALPKSMLGNVGAAVETSALKGSLDPLKALFSMETLKDAAQSFKTGSGIAANPAGQASTSQLPKLLSLPGRLMGAADEATQMALQRGGVAAKEAQAATLQSPLTGRLGEVFESSATNPNPMASYLHPFRRTPFNQLLEGLDTFKGGSGMTTVLGKNPGVQAAYMGAGAVHGASTADDQTPMSIPLAIAASGRRGLPYGVAALIARGLAEGKGGGGIAGSMIPVSEYGYEQSLSNPFKPFTNPAALTALDKIIGSR